MNFENLRIKDVSTVLHFDADMRRWDAKNRSFHIIGIKLSGSAFHELGYKSFTLSRSCIYFFNRRDDYHVEVEEPGEAFSIHFTTYEDIDTDSFCIPTESPEKIVALLQKAEVAKEDSDSGELSLLSTVYKLCSVISEIRQKGYLPKDSRIKRAKSYMDIHFKDSDCLTAAVKSTTLSSRRFGELFKAHYNITPNKYIVMKKISHAKELLESGGISVREVGELCGFSDIYYFSRVFREICGIPPSVWGKR